jgi:hypothetical protein
VGVDTGVAVLEGWLVGVAVGAGVAEPQEARTSTRAPIPPTPHRFEAVNVISAPNAFLAVFPGSDATVLNTRSA